MYVCLIVTGSPVLSAEVEVPITVINEATPIFTQQFYSISIPENTPSHTAVLSIEATSPTGKKLIYSINGGDDFDEFGVDFNTGVYLTLVLMTSPCDCWSYCHVNFVVFVMMVVMWSTLHEWDLCLCVSPS